MRKFQPTSARQTEEERLARLEECGLRLARLALAARKATKELDEASSWGATSNGSVTPGRSVSKESDPTGTVAVSEAHSIMRARVQELTSLIVAIDTSSLEKSLAGVERKAEDAIRFAWDPELREMLKRADEADRDYRQRHAHKR